MEKGHIKQIGNHRISSVKELKKKLTVDTIILILITPMIAKFSETSSSELSTKERLGIEGYLLPANMVSSSFPKGKFKVLTFEKVKEAKAVDSARQILAAEYQEMKKKQDRQISRSNILETYKSGEMRRRPTIRILLNKWQRQKEKVQMRQERDYWRYQEEYERRRV